MMGGVPDVEGIVEGASEEVGVGCGEGDDGVGEWEGVDFPEIFA